MRPEQQMSFIDTNYSKPNSFLRSNSHNNHHTNTSNSSSNNGSTNGTYTNGNNSYTNGNHSYTKGNGQPQFQKVFANNLYDVKNFKDEFLDVGNNSYNNKAKSVSPNELLGFELNNMEDKMKTREPQTDIENLNSQLKNTEISIKGLN